MFVCCCFYCLFSCWANKDVYTSVKVSDHHQLSTRPSHLQYTLTCCSDIINMIASITTLLDFCWILLVLNTVGSMYEGWIECLAGGCLNCRSGADSEAGYRNVNGGNLCLYNCVPVILNIIHVNRFTSLVQWPSETWTTIPVMCNVYVIRCFFCKFIL